MGNTRAYNLAHKQESIARLKAWKKKYPERSRKSHRDYERKHKAEALERVKKYQRADPERRRRNERLYAQRHPEANRIKTNRRRTRMTAAGGSFTAAEWKALCKRYGNRCLCCGKRRKLTADHVIPVSKGGTSNIDNIQPLCGPCNSSKRDKTTDYRKRHYVREKCTT